VAEQGVEGPVRVQLGEGLGQRALQQAELQAARRQPVAQRRQRGQQVGQVLGVELGAVGPGRLDDEDRQRLLGLRGGGQRHVVVDAQVALEPHQRAPHGRRHSAVPAGRNDAAHAAACAAAGGSATAISPCSVSVRLCVAGRPLASAARWVLSWTT
jgi:hypothetical protein